MKSIKPGRGPSMMSGVMSIAMGVFGVIWTFAAASMGGGFMALFGLVFIAVAVIQAVFHFKNATGENRYSTYDIVSGEEEPDPLNARYGRPAQSAPADTGTAFCPYCGTPAEENYEYCRKCGKKLP